MIFSFTRYEGSKYQVKKMLQPLRGLGGVHKFKMLKFFRYFFFLIEEYNFVRENNFFWKYWKYSFLEMEYSKLINHWADMC
jgi:hypothetical protein